jgi:Transposase DDE domain
MHNNLRDRVHAAAGQTTAHRGRHRFPVGEGLRDDRPHPPRLRSEQDNDRKRHITVNTIGLLLTVLITAAGVQDRDAAKPLLWSLRRAFPTVKLAWADGGYAGSWSPGPGSGCA